MRVQICTGRLIAFVFLSIIAVSHAFVFWIPVWKTTSVLRYHPKKGWKPVSHGWKAGSASSHSHIGFKVQKPFGHHHLSHHPKHKHVGWKPKLNLHKVCHLCHVPSWRWKKPSHHHQHYDHKNHFHSPGKGHYPSIFKFIGFGGLGGFGRGGYRNGGFGGGGNFGGRGLGGGYGNGGNFGGRSLGVRGGGFGNFGGRSLGVGGGEFGKFGGRSLGVGGGGFGKFGGHSLGGGGFQNFGGGLGRGGFKTFSSGNDGKHGKEWKSSGWDW